MEKQFKIIIQVTCFNVYEIVSFLSKDMSLFPGDIIACGTNAGLGPMDHGDIKFLISNGHLIGCHTLSHQMLSKISSLNELNEEIVSSKNKLEKDFDIKIKHFAFPFGTFDSINQSSLKILNKNYQFIHSGLRGNNKKATKLIYRDAVNPEMKINRFKAFLTGNADFIYKRKFKKLNGYLN